MVRLAVEVKANARSATTSATKHLRSKADPATLRGMEIALTFVDPQLFRGTCYRAANWTDLRDTTGRGKDAPTHKANRSIKRVLGYSLVQDFRPRLQTLAEAR